MADQIQSGTTNAVATSTNAWAVASLVVGILWLGGIGALLALVFGYLALRQIRRSGGTQGGRGLALAGVVLGWVGLAISAGIAALLATGTVTWFEEDSPRASRPSRLETTLKNAAVAEESFKITSGQGYTAEIAALEGEGFGAPDDITVTLLEVTADSYCIEATDGAVTMFYDSEEGTPQVGTC